MKIIEAKAFIDQAVDGEAILKHIEAAGRVCYKSEEHIAEKSAEKFVRGILKRGHEAVIEHVSISARFICDRGVTHEIVRHRVASYCQESTRYCNYSQDKFDGGQITFIKPLFWEETDALSTPYRVWKEAMQNIENTYLWLIDHGAQPQEARSVLPNSVKTEIVMTCNLREWRHFFRLRCAKAAHPQMRQVALMLLKEFHEKIPVFFDDLWEMFGEEASQ